MEAPCLPYLPQQNTKDDQYSLWELFLEACSREGTHHQHVLERERGKKTTTAMNNEAADANHHPADPEVNRFSTLP